MVLRPAQSVYATQLEMIQTEPVQTEIQDPAELETQASEPLLPTDADKESMPSVTEPEPTSLREEPSAPPLPTKASEETLPPVTFPALTETVPLETVHSETVPETVQLLNEPEETTETQPPADDTTTESGGNTSEQPTQPEQPSADSNTDSENSTQADDEI